MSRLKDGRRAQAGATLVELMVSLMIAGLALALIVGTLSTGLLDATLAKRNTAVQAIMQYETEQVGAAAFDSAAQSYSECFATEDPTSKPALASAYQAGCPGNVYTLRADVQWSWVPSSTTVQVWTIAVNTWPASPNPVTSVQVYKVPHQ
jgi:type II secretory pathway pseudopilin PulG